MAKKTAKNNKHAKRLRASENRKSKKLAAGKKAAVRTVEGKGLPTRHAPSIDLDGIATYDEMREEAVYRLGLLTDAGLHPCVLEDFTCNPETPLYYSENYGYHGILYWVDQPESTTDQGVPFRDLVNDFEKHGDRLVYHIIHEYLSFSGEVRECLYYLYVSKYKEEWEGDRHDLLNGTPFIMCPMLEYPGIHDWGHIGISVIGGGLVANHKSPRPLVA